MIAASGTPPIVRPADPAALEAQTGRAVFGEQRHIIPGRDIDDYAAVGLYALLLGSTTR
ncbi:hypothetical protein ACFQX7_07650 [Luedemannella flava]|uniref:hypothetical protein n=1 Tax=Luedemannella flava TaxID=349316 RepID=UPI0031D6EF17